VLVPFVLTVVAAALLGGAPLLIPPAVLCLGTGLYVWRARDRVPETLRELRRHLGADESVAGDAVGRAKGVRGWRDALRLVVATDRRLLVATSPRSNTQFLLVDTPYEHVTGFGVAWKYRGRLGTLSLTLDGLAPETHVIDAIAPANLVSIARALQSHDVRADDPEAVAAAERAWEEALAIHRSTGRVFRKPTFDRAAMNTTAFDRGLWLLLAVSGPAFYANPLGNPALLLAIVLGAAGLAGYVSRTKSSLGYLVPFNLLLAPAFLFWPAGTVVSLMVSLSAVAALGLWAGARFRRARHPRPPVSPERRPPRGTLRYTIGGVSLIRLTGVILAVLLGLVAVSTAAGIEPSKLRLAVFEATARQLPVEGRSDLTGGTASLTYTPSRDLREFVTDQHLGGGPFDGARWELRSSWRTGFNVVSLASFVEPVDDPAAVAKFVAGKDDQHAGLAGYTVTHTTRVVDGHRAYVWNHDSNSGNWYYAAWFPQPGYSVRVECIAKEQKDRFKRLCAQAMRSLRFR
jgi:hypothetical protein